MAQVPGHSAWQKVRVDRRVRDSVSDSEARSSTAARATLPAAAAAASGSDQREPTAASVGTAVGEGPAGSDLRRRSGVLHGGLQACNGADVMALLHAHNRNSLRRAVTRRPRRRPAAAAEKTNVSKMTSSELKAHAQAF